METSFFTKVAIMGYDKLDPAHTGKITKESFTDLMNKLCDDPKAVEKFVKEVFDEEPFINRGETDDFMALVGCYLYADKDNDGRISFPELIAFYKEVKTPFNLYDKSDENIKEDFEYDDPEKTGKIGFGTFIRFFDLKKRSAMVNPKKKINSEERDTFRNKMVEIGFNKLDANKDGIVTQDELLDFAKKLNLSEDHIEQINYAFEKLKKKELNKTDMPALFAAFGHFFYVDKNNDYLVEFEDAYNYAKEVKYLFRFHDAPKSIIMKEFAEYDNNKDGKFNFEEFDKIFSDGLFDLF